MSLNGVIHPPPYWILCRKPEHRSSPELNGPRRIVIHSSRISIYRYDPEAGGTAPLTGVTENLARLEVDDPQETEQSETESEDQNQGEDEDDVEGEDDDSEDTHDEEDRNADTRAATTGNLARLEVANTQGTEQSQNEGEDQDQDARETMKMKTRTPKTRKMTKTVSVLNAATSTTSTDTSHASATTSISTMRSTKRSPNLRSSTCGDASLVIMPQILTVEYFSTTTLSFPAQLGSYS